VLWTETTKSFLRFVADGALDILFPRTCLGCGLQPAPGAPVCDRCLTSIEPVDAFDLEEFFRSDERIPELFDAASILWRYRKSGLASSIHTRFKYENRPRYGDWIGGLMSLRAIREFASPDMVVPIPLHRTRRRERGYNQALELARPLSRSFDCTLAAEVLIRVRPTKRQTGLDRTERSLNLESAFRVTDPLAIRGRRVLLVDDVVTTGATTLSAASELKRCEPSWIGLAAMAVAGR